jgi:Spy/CpxP family protein refolding chaperone
MERRSWFKRIGMAVLGLGAIGVLGAFRGAHGHGGHDPERMAEMVTKRLDSILDEIEATPEQRQRITAVKDRLLEKGKALHAERRGMMQDLLAQWRSPAIDAAAVHSKIDARAEAMKGFAHEAADALAEVHGILTPEQREEVAARWEQKMRRHGKRGSPQQPEQQ